MAVTEVQDAVCSDCDGTGWLQVDDLDDVVRPCSCRQRKDLRRLLAEARIPARYAECRLDTFRPTHTHESQAGHHEQVRAKTLSQRFVDDFLLDEIADTGLLFVGRPGSGKTHLAVAVLYELITRYGLQGRFVDFTELTRKLQSAMDRDSGESTGSILRSIEDVKVLLLDELGSIRLTAWTQEILTTLVNGRYQRRLPTIFTSNYPLEALRNTPIAQEGAEDVFDHSKHSESPREEILESRIPQRLVSRIYEMAQPIELWQVGDYRRQVRALRLRV